MCCRSESALALVIAHQLAHHVLGHQRVDMKLAFPDVLKISNAELLAKLKFRYTSAEEAAEEADADYGLVLADSACSISCGIG
jgi:hypothetical protein